MIDRRLPIRIALAGILALTSALAAGDANAESVVAGARTYPNRAVRIIVPFPAGGPTDILMRVIGQRLSEI